MISHNALQPSESKMAAHTKRFSVYRRSLCSYSRVKRASTRRPDKNIDRIIRVDHAGELGADRIYAGQYAVLKNTSAGPVIKEMWDQEKAHLGKFEELIRTRRVRPTLLTPAWNAAGFLLGAGTALLGKEAAMACTVAVEEIIGDHYDSQLRELLKDGIKEEHKELMQTIQVFRDDELEHLEKGNEYGADQAPMYSILKKTIQTGCKLAIWIAERI